MRSGCSTGQPAIITVCGVGGPNFLDFSTVVGNPHEKAFYLDASIPQCSNLTYYDLNIESNLKSGWPSIAINGNALQVNATEASHVGAFPV